MTTSQDSTNPENSHGDLKLTCSFHVYAEHKQRGWSTGNVTSQDRGLATFTVLEEARGEETRNFFAWFEHGASSDPLGVTRLFYFNHAFDQIPTDVATGTLTKISVQSSDPIIAPLRKSEGCVIIRPTPLQVAVFRRISELMELAADDAIEMSPSSFSDLWSFISARPAASVPTVFALDNGNFRAVWKNSRGERVALEFQGGQIVGFIIFEYDQSMTKMMRMAGILGVNQIQAQIAAVRAEHLLTR